MPATTPRPRVTAGDPVLCFACRMFPAGNDLAGAHSAYCACCQPWPGVRPVAAPAPAIAYDDAVAHILALAGSEVFHSDPQAGERP